VAIVKEDAGENGCIALTANIERAGGVVPFLERVESIWLECLVRQQAKNGGWGRLRGGDTNARFCLSSQCAAHTRYSKYL
jgi:hypothetical protein